MNEPIRCYTCCKEHVEVKFGWMDVVTDPAGFRVILCVPSIGFTSLTGKYL
jgi:hypothetical protein